MPVDCVIEWDIVVLIDVVPNSWECRSNQYRKTYSGSQSRDETALSLMFGKTRDMRLQCQSVRISTIFMRCEIV